MRTIKIVADSSCDLFGLKHTAFACAPMKVITAEREFVDDTSLNVDAMVQHFDHYKGKSKSSCPNTGDWLAAFGDADDIFCVTITSGLSGSYNSACSAKRIYEAENAGKRVFVIDTLSAGPEITLVIEKLEECIDLSAAVQQRCKAQALSDIQRTDALGGVDFMALRNIFIPLWSEKNAFIPT